MGCCAALGLALAVLVWFDGTVGVAAEVVMTDGEQLAISVIPKVTGTMSLIGSAFIVASVVQDKSRHSLVYHRLLLVMGALDMLVSFIFILGTWLIPRGTAGVAEAVGTEATCEMQGFLVQFGLIVPFYNAMLSVNYLLVIRYGWSNVQVREVEKWMHVGSWVWPVATAVAGLPLLLYNNANLWCWIAPLPVGCSNDPAKISGGAAPCERGNHAAAYQFGFFYGELWALMIFCSVAMSLVVDKVRKQEARVAKLQTNASGRADSIRSRRVATQALMYVGAFFLTWLPGTLNRAYQAATGSTLFPLLLLHSVFVPMQGFLNFLVYNRPYWLRYREAHPETSLCHTVVMFFLCCCFYKRTDRRDPDAPRTSIYNLGVGRLVRKITSGGRASSEGAAAAAAAGSGNGNGTRRPSMGTRRHTTAHTESGSERQVSEFEQQLVQS